MQRSFLKDERLLLAAIVLAAVAVRVAFLALPRVVRWDEAAHQLIAHSLLAGRGFSELVGARDVQQGPLVSYLSLPGVWLRWPVSWSTGGIAYVLFGGLLPLPLYGLGYRLYNRRIGLIAALLAAIYPALVAGPLYWGTMTEPPYLFFIVSGLYCTWRAAECVYRGERFARTLVWGLGIGVALGLAYLTRPEALASLAVMLFYVVLAGVARVVARSGDRPQQEDRPQRSWARWRLALGAPLGVALISLAVFFVVTLPYDIYIYRVIGSWAISGKQGLAADIAQAVAKGDAAEMDRSGAALDSTGREIMWLSLEQFNESIPGFMTENPRQFIRHVRGNITAMWQALFHADLFSPWMIALIALGLWAWLWTRARLARELLLLLMLIPLVALLAFFVISRLLVIAIPVALLWAAAGLDHLANWAGRSLGSLVARDRLPPDSRTGADGPVGRVEAPLRQAQGAQFIDGFALYSLRFFRAVPLAFTLVAFLCIGAGLAGRELPKQPFWRTETARWLADHVPAGSPVMVRDSEVALYADMPMVAFPNAEWPQVLAYGQARGARYLVAEENQIRELRPQLALLLDASQPAPGVTLLAQLPGPGASRTFVYAFEVVW